MDELYKLTDSGAHPGWFTCFADFIRQDDSTDGGATDFTAISSGTNTGTIAQATGTNATGGVARLSGVSSVTATGGQIAFQPAFGTVDGRNVHFKCRARLFDTTSTNVATASSFFAGLFPVGTGYTNITAATINDGIYFTKGTNTAVVQCVTTAGTTNQATSTLGASTTAAAGAFTMDRNYHDYGISVFTMGACTNAVNVVEFNIDGVTVARHVNVVLPSGSNILSPSLAFASQDGTGTKFVDVDYIGGAQQRGVVSTTTP